MHDVGPRLELAAEADQQVDGLVLGLGRARSQISGVGPRRALTARSRNRCFGCARLIDCGGEE